MRDRHIPRLCGTCQAPMSRQEDACWRCGAQWASEDVPRTKLRVIAGGKAARPDTDRWTNEGGSVGSEPAAVAVALPRP
jgi:hypothetical protein